MRPTRRAVSLLATALVLAGLVVLLLTPTTVTYIGDSGLSMGDEAVTTVETSAVGFVSVGPALLWLGTVLAAGAFGHWSAGRRPASR